VTKVIDSSVVLAGILGEPGGEILEDPGELFHFSMVNLAEVHTKVVERGGAIEDVNAYLGPLSIRLRTFRAGQAETIGRLRPLTRHLGLSLGDRACLALGLQTGLPVLTADTKWIELDLGIDIRLIR
jgi:ribonuclease VapC